MRQISAIILFLSFVFSLSAQNSVYLDIQALKQDYVPVEVPCFQPTTELTEGIAGIKSYQLLDYNYNVARATIASAPLISIPLALNGKTYDLELKEVNVTASDFLVRDALDQPVDVRLGKFYHGTVNGEPNSMAAISIFEDEVVGVFATQDEGNFVLGQMQSGPESSHILYRERDLTVHNHHHCTVSDSDVPSMPTQAEMAAMAAADRCKNVSVYFEADNILYRDKQSNMTSVTNYITGLYNVVILLYQNEDINTDISEIKIWNTRDPYRKDNSSNCLNDFNSAMGNNFNGDLAHLLTTSRTNIGGRAYVNILCNSRNRTAISNIGNSYRTYPSYSWTIEVVTHEMGHNLGSPHTHRCFWGPNNNQAIDNCATTEGSCVPGPRPNGGGTIMSYCHLTSFGINLTKGFGEEPGDLIRFRVANAACLGGAFEAEAINQGEETFYLGDSTTLRARPIGVQYDYQWYKNDLPIVGATRPDLVVKTSGEYYCQVTTGCYEETNRINVNVEDFFVSLKCPPSEGAFDFVEVVSDTFIVDSFTFEVTIDVPESLHQSIPADAVASEVEIYYCAGDYGISFLSHLNINVWGPANSNVVNQEIRDHKLIAKGNRCFDEQLGDFDPTGEWTFRLSDNNNNNVGAPESYVQFHIRQKWQYAPQPSDCNAFICDGQTIELDAGFPNLEYEWSTGETTQKILVDEIGTYGVTVSNGPIMRSDDIEVLIAPTNYSVDTLLCYGDVFGLGSQNITTAGEYTEAFTSSGGCDSIVTAMVAFKEENVTGLDTFICYLEEIDGVPYNFSVDESEVFTGADGCDSIYATKIEVNPEMKMTFSVNRGCEDKGGVIEATGSGGSGSGYTYEWSTGDVGAVLNGAKSGFITCTVTDDKGCKFEKPVSIGNFDSVGVEIMTMDNVCFGDTNGTAMATTISGRSPFTFNWSTGEMTESISGLAADTYTLIVTDRNDCSKEVDVIIEENEVITANEIASDAGAANDGTITLDPQGGVAPYTYLWEDNGSTAKDRTDLAAGFYTVVITDSEDCSIEIEIEVKMRTSIIDWEQVANFDIFPNPATEMVNMHIDLIHPMEVIYTLIDIHGRTWLTNKSAESESFELKLPLQDVPSGMYMIQLQIGEDTGLVPIVKK